MATYNELCAIAKRYVDANIWDGEDRSGCNKDFVRLTPDELQELIDNLIEHLGTMKII